MRPPVIRPGQRHPYRKGTRREIDERRGFVARLLASGARKMEIHRAVQTRFGVHWRQCDRYIDFVSGQQCQPRKWLAHEKTHWEPVSPQLEEVRRMMKLCYPQG